MDTRGTETINDEGAIKTTVETVDHRVPPGKDQEPTNEKIGVVHLTRNKREPAGSGGFLASATGAVGRTFKSAKDALMGKGQG